MSIITKHNNDATDKLNNKLLNTDQSIGNPRLENIFIREKLAACAQFLDLGEGYILDTLLLILHFWCASHIQYRSLMNTNISISSLEQNVGACLLNGASLYNSITEVNRKVPVKFGHLDCTFNNVV